MRFLRIHPVQKVINNPTQLSGRGFPRIFHMELFSSQLYVFWYFKIEAEPCNSNICKFEFRNFEIMKFLNFEISNFAFSNFQILKFLKFIFFLKCWSLKFYILKVWNFKFRILKLWLLFFEIYKFWNLKLCNYEILKFWNFEI